ncbi:MAG: hypothetical protein ACRDF4_02640 [Rhabdochlamydiaceae bacterium]
MSIIQENIERRAKFYNSPQVAKFLSKEGVPGSKQAMRDLIAAGGSITSGSEADSTMYDCLNFVVFAIHPQQINVRDKANGKIIAVIPR